MLMAAVNVTLFVSYVKEPRLTNALLTIVDSAIFDDSFFANPSAPAATSM